MMESEIDEMSEFNQIPEAFSSSSEGPMIKLPGIIDNKLYSFVRVGKTTGDVTRIAANCLFCKGGKEIWGDNKSTGNFTKHLRKFHSTEYADHQKRKLEIQHPGESQPTIKKFCPVKSVSCGMKKKADNLIMSYIVNAMRPLSTVNDPAFRKMVTGLCGDPKLKIFSVDTLKIRINIAYNELVEKNVSQLHPLDYICLTADCWSSHSRAFLGVTCHWITSDYSRESIVLACTRFKGVHSYDKIADQLTTIINNYKIPLSQIVAVVTDNGSNFCKAFKEFGIVFEKTTEPIVEDSEHTSEDKQHSDLSDGDSDEGAEDEVQDQTLADLFEEQKEYSLPPHCRCASHTLSLVATKDGLEVKDKRLYHSAVAKCTKLWNLSWSPKSAEIVTKICGTALKRPVPTRWNSMYDSLKCLLSKEKHLDALCDALRVAKFQQKEIEFLKEFVLVSEPIAIALDRMQGEKGNFMGSLLPTLVKTVSLLQDLKLKVKYCKDFASAYLKGMETRFGEIMKVDTHNPSDYVLGAISNPAFKLRWVQKDSHEALKAKFISRAKLYSSGSLPPQNDKEEDEDPFYDFKELEPTCDSSTSNVELECTMYFNDFSQKLSMLKQYPTVEKMFRRFNTSLPSSAPVERLFSYAGLIFSSRRTRLSDTTFEKLVLLKSNHVFGNV